MSSDTSIREQWLQSATTIFRDVVFKDLGSTIPQVKVSVGFPGGGNAKRRIGEHWSPEASDDQIGSVFISPTIDDTDTVLGTLVHELVHATVGNRAGHGPAFRKLATTIGLEGKMRSTHPGKSLKVSFQTIINILGPYPHRKLNLAMRPTKKQTTRMIKMTCPDCGYIVRAARGAIDEHGPAICPCNHQPMVVE